MHDYIVIGLSIVSCVGALFNSIGVFLVRRLVRHLDALEDAKERHSKEIRDTRQAISRIEGKLEMDPFPYTSE